MLLPTWDGLKSLNTGVVFNTIPYFFEISLLKTTGLRSISFTSSDVHHLMRSFGVLQIQIM